MKEITIHTENFKQIKNIESADIDGLGAYVTIAKDRKGNDGILLFIPTRRPKSLIWNLD